MKRKTGICIIMALLMIVSAFTISTVTAADPEYKGEVVFTKKVWDKEAGEWADEIEAEIDETLKFKLEIKYHMDEYYSEAPLHLYDINITDIFTWGPYCFEYIDGSATIPPTDVIVDYSLFWELDVEIEDNESLSIEFELLVVNIDCEVLTNYNWAEVAANECGVYEHREEDFVTINLKYGLEVEKKVWDPEKQIWADDLPYVMSCENVKFQITATYYGNKTMKCLVIGDLLPEECLEYLKTTKVIIAGDIITESDSRYPDIYNDLDNIIVICNREINLSDIVNYAGDYATYWDWRNADFNLHNGESVIVEFEANVTQYSDCCDCKVKNWAVALLWGCYICDPCSYFLNCDFSNVTCCPPPSIFEKKVKDPDTGNWVEEINTFIDEKVRFKLEFTYYGNSDLTDVRIVDNLPCVLVYADQVQSSINITVEVSSDGKTIWFNMSDDIISDCDTVIIEFDALVIDATGGCEDCKAINHATLYVYEEQQCQDVIVAQYTDTANVTVDYNCDPFVKYLIGDENGEPGDTLEFKAKGKDPCDSNLEYWFDWGDGTNSGWIGPYASDTQISKTNSWSREGIFNVKVKVKDIHDAESDWSEPALKVNITKGGPDIIISFKKFGFNKVPAIITNILGTNIEHVSMNMTGTYGFILKKEINATEEDKTLVPGDNPFEPKLPGLLGKIGPINVEVNVVIDEETFTETASGFVLGKLVILTS